MLMARTEQRGHTLPRVLMPARLAAGRTRMLPILIVGLISLVGAVTATDILFDRLDRARSDAFRISEAATFSFQLSLVDAEAGVRGFILSGTPQYLASYQVRLATLTNLLDQLRAAAASQPAAYTRLQRTIDGLKVVQTAWDNAIGLVAANQRAQAATALLAPDAQSAMNRLRNDVADYLATETAAASQWSARAADIRSALHAVDLAGILIALAAMIYAFGRIMTAISSGFQAQEQTERLFSMTDMLQSAVDLDDTNEVLRATVADLLPGLSGALYVFNNSRDRLDLAMQWGSAAHDCVDHLLPNACWALKRGKPHLNSAALGALRCRHMESANVALEIPMAARGELYGLLQISTAEADGAATLKAAQPIASAIADAMSLALSSLALRERLRNQALRDPLTGLYNRRFLEEMLERLCVDAERRHSSIAAIMLDLDHFKKLNDQHGHGAGDAVLRDVASVVLSCLRSTDVACRYGGEELAILLPDCTMAMAMGKAEQIRVRITELTLGAGLSVTASLGVAAIPETAAGQSDLLSTADAALYHSKQHGRDRVTAAASRISSPHLSLVEPSA